LNELDGFLGFRIIESKMRMIEGRCSGTKKDRGRERETGREKVEETRLHRGKERKRDLFSASAMTAAIEAARAHAAVTATYPLPAFSAAAAGAFGKACRCVCACVCVCVRVHESARTHARQKTSTEKKTEERQNKRKSCLKKVSRVG